MNRHIKHGLIEPKMPGKKQFRQYGMTLYLLYCLHLMISLKAKKNMLRCWQKKENTWVHMKRDEVWNENVLKKSRKKFVKDDA